MSYQGTTAASSVANVPVKLAWGGIAGGFVNSTLPATNMSTANGPMSKQANSLWLYHTTDLSSAFCSSGTPYFTDAINLGMRVGDMVMGLAGVSSGYGTGLTYLMAITNISTAGAYGSTQLLMRSTGIT